jgi:hypothetical protein
VTGGLGGPGGGGPSDRHRTEAERRIEEELRDLSTEYAAAVDERDGERFAGLFTDDGELVVPRLPDELRPVVTRSGHDQLARIPAALSRFERTFHQMSNHRFAIGDAVARGEVLCLAHHASLAGGGAGGGAADGIGDGVGAGTDLVWVIRYRDTYRDTGPAWRIARRELHLQWVEERAIVPPGILRGSVGAPWPHPAGTGSGGGGPT